MQTEIMKELTVRHADPRELTEGDTWVNDATRKDIANIARENNFQVFGLEFWSKWNKVKGENLLNVYNFGVSLLFKNEQEPIVDKLIAEYKAKAEKHWSMKLDMKIVDKLYDIALYDCSWV